ncbi:MAG: KH domain-containing protein [Candidatus Euphemobacter frigidus]|nr:KH domain-containing protein [Candidatus Euphemobacter frigidus]MDP8275369.1 KH domain-containing protein [Candidatus Euphemobacter frigidus]
MKELIEYIVKSIVDSPESVNVTQIDGESTIVFELRVQQDDVGKVIGKKGRTINAIRTLVNATAAKSNMRAMLEIVEEEKQF